MIKKRATKEISEKPAAPAPRHYSFSRVKSYAVIAGERLRAAREEAKMTRQELIAYVPYFDSHNTINNYEHGKREMSAQTAVILGHAVNRHPAFLVGLIDEHDQAILMLPDHVRKDIYARYVK